MSAVWPRVTVPGAMFGTVRSGSSARVKSLSTEATEMSCACWDNRGNLGTVLTRAPSRPCHTRSFDVDTPRMHTHPHTHTHTILQAIAWAHTHAHIQSNTMLMFLFSSGALEQLLHFAYFREQRTVFYPLYSRLKPRELCRNSAIYW